MDGRVDCRDSDLGDDSPMVSFSLCLQIHCLTHFIYIVYVIVNYLYVDEQVTTSLLNFANLLNKVYEILALRVEANIHSGSHDKIYE